MFKQTKLEEILNGSTHAVGLGLSLAGLVLLVVFASLRGDAWHIVSCSIYGATLIILYNASTLYHFTTGERLKKFYQLLDHSAIFLLIAGTYTPFTLVNLRGPWGWTLFGLVWGLALIGVLLESFCTHRFRLISLPIYLLMGWLIVIAAKPLIHSVPTGGLVWLALGGLAYTLGAIFYAWERLPFGHSIWHLFVLAGSICHFFSILFYVVPGK